MDIQEIVAGISASGALGNAAQSAGLQTGQARDVLHGVLSHFDGGGALETLAESVAAKAGISQTQVQAFLPQVLPLLQQHSANASEGVQGVIGGFINSMSGGGGSGVGGIVKGLFG
jgi:hypothetical protein